MSSETTMRVGVGDNTYKDGGWRAPREPLALTGYPTPAFSLTRGTPTSPNQPTNAEVKLKVLTLLLDWLTN